MEQQPKSLSPDQFTSAQALVRFVLRLALLSVFAAFSAHGFTTAFSALAGMAALFCAIVAAMRQEAIFRPALTHWDVAAAYALVGWLLRAAPAAS